MHIDPLNAIGEILGEPAAEMRNPVNAEYRCPFTDAICTKKSHRFKDPFPVCSVWVGGKPKSRLKDKKLIATCPKRFYQTEYFSDVLQYCWPGEPPRNPMLAEEINMSGFGRVDFVIADIDQNTGDVGKFVSVEMQAVDTTGSYEPAYQAVLNSQESVDVTYNINWANVRKRYLSQLVSKGFYHHAWGSRIVAILQTPLYERIRNALKFDELPATSQSNAVTFLLYDFKPDLGASEGFSLELDRVVATSHNSLMMASMYQDVPPIEDFRSRIKANLSR